MAGADDLFDDFAGIPDAVDGSVDVSESAPASAPARSKASKRSKATAAPSPGSLKRKPDAGAAQGAAKKRVRDESSSVVRVRANARTREQLFGLHHDTNARAPVARLREGRVAALSLLCLRVYLCLRLTHAQRKSKPTQPAPAAAADAIGSAPPDIQLDLLVERQGRSLTSMSAIERDEVRLQGALGMTCS